MKKKNKHSTYRRKKEFRYSDIKTITKSGKAKIIKHPAYIFLENEDLFIYVTLTHSKNVKNYLVIKLRKNPNPNDEEESYYVAKIRKDFKNNFGTRILNWEVDVEDDKDIRRLFDETKKDDSAA